MRVCASVDFYLLYKTYVTYGVSRQYKKTTCGIRPLLLYDISQYLWAKLLRDRRVK